MKLNISIRWNRTIGIHREDDVTKLPVDLDYVSDHEDLVQAIKDTIGEYSENTDFEIVNEEQFWLDAECPFNEITSPSFNALIKSSVDELKLKKAEQILIDNGIEADEAQDVLQAIGYALLDTELYPEG